MYRVLIRRTSEQRCVWCKLLYFEHQGNFKENFLLFSRVGTDVNDGLVEVLPDDTIDELFERVGVLRVKVHYWAAAALLSQADAVLVVAAHP